MKQITLTLMIPIFLITLTCHAGAVQDSGIKGGIVVHLNCGDGVLTAEMPADNSCLIHGLDTDAGKITKARAHLRSKGLAGRVSVARYDGKTLPYASNIVNLLIADSLGEVPMKEVMRVLTPRGAAIIGGNKPVKKPWPADIDTWPQYLNKADNNAVAMDSVVGPPRRIQWLDTPTWGRSHMAISTFASAVTCNGRMFSIEDRSLPDNPYLPGAFMYVARDAFNGRLLWTREIRQWESITTYIKCLPTQQQRRMVATDDILYCTPVLEGPLVALDAATGKTIKTYDGLSPVQEVAYDQGILFVNVGDRFNASAYNQTHKKANRAAAGTPSEPFNGSGFRKGYAPEIKDKAISASVIVAVDPKTGRKLWSTKGLKNYTGASFAVKGDRAVYQTGQGMFCINPKTGKKLWSVKKDITNQKGHDSHTPGTMPNTVVITDDKAFAVEGKMLLAYSLKDGKVLWRTGATACYEASVDVFYINGLVWLGGKGVSAYDAETGKHVKTLKQQVTGPMVHDRCYRNMITQKYFINSKTGGADFLGLESGGEFPNHWTRGGCGMGVLPANGLLYSTPYSCTCSIGDMLPGVNAYRADPELIKSNDAGVIKRKVRLEKGDAYGKIAAGAKAGDGDWATYRGNNFRGGMTASPVGAKLAVKWRAKLPTVKPTAVTVAGGKVFVCDPDAHMLYALDSSSGKTLWTFTADGRIDSPPTCHKGMVLFGSHDGWLYCLRAADGELAWRFKDLPDRLVGAFGQLESAWPISGAVLVQDDKVYASAGRSSFLDGGIFLYCLDPATGELLKSRSAYGPFAEKTGFPIAVKSTGIARGGRRGKKGRAPAYIRPGFRNGVLVSDGAGIYLRHAAFAKDLSDNKTTGEHLMPLGGFLDPRVQHRTGFILASRFQWWRNEPKDIMISDKTNTYSVAGFQSSHNHAYFDPRTSAYKLIGKDLKVALPINGRALTKAADVIFVAGEPMKFKDPIWRNYVAAYSGKLGGRLLALSARDGKELASYKLPAAPIWDSIAIAKGRLYISLTDGTIQCMGQ
ncbi:MAG: PQQ-binding-like beta-propeller repeat protein [Phycisphaerales bacterium]|nr:PQQ-binding-like beta-propeller repeat protein [Phycisphaerales bacterium]